MVKNENGFTIIELLATIALLLIVASVLIPSIMSVSDTVKQTQYNAQIEIIKAGAKEYGEDNLNELQEETCTNKTVGELITLGYIKGDNSDKTQMTDPKTNDSMNCYVTCIKYELFYDSSDNSKKYYKVTAEVTAKKANTCDN